MQPSLRLQALQDIFSFYEQWAGQWSFACRPGCTACCTRSVTMTALEGRLLLSSLNEQDGYAQERFKALLTEGGKTGHRPALTTNQFAAACLAGRESEAQEILWDFAPCPLLHQGLCAVYPARPFVCRSFVSLARCGQAETAEVPALLLTVNTVLLQIIEHLDQGGLWGNLLAVLPALAGKRTAPALLRSQPCPGFLVPPEEQEAVNVFLAALVALPLGSRTLGEILGGP